MRPFVAGAIAATLVAVALAGIGLLPTASATAALPAASTASAQPQGLGIRLLDFPDTQKSDVRAHEYIVQSSRPGQTFTRHLEVSNRTGAAQVVTLSTTAASIANGSFDIGQTGQNSLATWIRPNVSSVNLANGATTTVSVTITVPPTALAGEQYGVVWAAMRAPATDGNQVTVVNRVGIRAYLNIDGTGTATPAFRIRSLSVDESRTVHASIVNTGDVALDITGTLGLSAGPGRTSAGPFAAVKTTTLAPGQGGSVAFLLPTALAAGTWHATVELVSGTVTHTSSTSIQLVTRADAPAKTPGFPWTVAAFVLGIFVLVVAVARFVSIRRRRNPRN